MDTQAEAVIRLYVCVCSAGDVLIQISDSQRTITSELEGVVRNRSSSIDPSISSDVVYIIHV